MKWGTINKCQNQEKQIKMCNHRHHRLHGRKAKSEWLKWTQLNWTELIAAGYWRLLTATTFSQNKFYFSLIFYFSFYFHYFFRIICFAIFAGGSAGVCDRWRANSDGMANVWCMHCLLAAQTINPWGTDDKTGKKKERKHTHKHTVNKRTFCGGKMYIDTLLHSDFHNCYNCKKKKLNESKYILKWHKWKAATTSYFKYLSILLQFRFYLLPEVLYIFRCIFPVCLNFNNSFPSGTNCNYVRSVFANTTQFSPLPNENWSVCIFRPAYKNVLSYFCICYVFVI